MLHEMKLQSKYYNYILHGTKRIELRLLDEKRQALRNGDIIRFVNLSNLSDTFEATIVDLLRYDNFKALLEDFSTDLLADKLMAKENLLIDLEEFYSFEEQNKYGVLGIKLKLK